MSGNRLNEYVICMAYTNAQLADLVRLRKEGKEYAQIAKWMKKNYGINKSPDSVRRAYKNYGNLFELSDEKTDIDRLKEVARVKRQNSKHSRVNRNILDYLNGQDNIIERITELVKGIKMNPIPPRELSKPKRGKKMTMELMISDIHVGKKTDTFNLEICRERIRQVTDAVTKEILQHAEQFKVERLVIALMGDIIESATMHGLESAKGCEFGNAKQVYEAVKLLFHDLIVPLAQTGIKRIDIPAVTGNHDRTESSRTYYNPGEENVTHIIYHTLRELCAASNLKNVKFDIPTSPYALVEIYGNNILIEHLDNAKCNTRNALEKLIADRQNQLGVVLDFLRGGHWHEYTVYGRGRIIVNDSVSGPDSYSDIKGFNSHAGQVLNFYIETNTRPNSFYKSYPIYLK